MPPQPVAGTQAAVGVAANLGFLWRELSFLERIAQASRAGFAAVEFHDEAQKHELSEVRDALAREGLRLLGLNTRAGDTAGNAADPDRKREARRDIDAAIAAARALGGTAVHVLAGRGEGTEASWRTFRANLVHAADAAPELIILVEPLSPAAAPGYRLASLDRAASLVEWVARPNVKIMFDVFHVHQVHGDVLRAYTAYRSHVGHIQVSDPRTRHEPPAELLQALRAMGYTGAFGAEYVPEQARSRPASAGSRVYDATHARRPAAPPRRRPRSRT